MRNLPQFGERKRLDAVVVRTDYSDEAAWWSLRAALAIGPAGELDWPLLVVDDEEWAGATVEEVRDAAAADKWLDVVFIADRTAQTGPGHRVLAVAASPASAKEFRVVPGWVLLVHGTLTATDVRFDAFAQSAARDPEGVFRGFAD